MHRDRSCAQVRCRPVAQEGSQKSPGAVVWARSQLLDLSMALHGPCRATRTATDTSRARNIVRSLSSSTAASALIRRQHAEHLHRRSGETEKWRWDDDLFLFSIILGCTGAKGGCLPTNASSDPKNEGERGRPGDWPELTTGRIAGRHHRKTLPLRHTVSGPRSRVFKGAFVRPRTQQIRRRLGLQVTVGVGCARRHCMHACRCTRASQFQLLLQL